MSIRWRKDGRMLCAAMTEPEEHDTYIDDRLHYQLSVISRTILADVNHETNGLWHWVHNDFLRVEAEHAVIARLEKACTPSTSPLVSI